MFGREIKDREQLILPPHGQHLTGLCIACSIHLGEKVYVVQSTPAVGSLDDLAQHAFRSRL